MPRTLVGLDIGSTGVRAAELVPGRRRSTLRRFAEVAAARPAWSAPARSWTARR